MKNAETKKTGMDEGTEINKRKTVFRLGMTEVLFMLFGGVGVFFMEKLTQTAADKLLSHLVMTMAMFAITGFQIRQEYIRGTLDYDNKEHPFRFWVCMGVGLAAAFGCSFLPVEGWPFLVIFVMLSLFSNMETGILAASSLLLLSVCLSNESLNSFTMYFVSGCFAAVLFHRMGQEFKIGIPLLLSVLCLLLCETGNVILLANARPDLETFLMPLANMIISSILLAGGLKLFSSMVIYRYRVKYLELNDSENPVLTAFKAAEKEEYLICIHTAYFCERIGKKLGLDTEALKGAAYYHRLGENLQNVMKEQAFPPQMQEILQEYLARKPVRRKETAILICADVVVYSMTQLIRKKGDQPIEYGAVIDAIFKKMLEEKRFRYCNITMQEFDSMQQIFKEEKLYYDFLR